MSTTFVNFGGNVRFRPERVLTPRTRSEVLACLDTYRGRTIRALGSLHSWSPAAEGLDVVLDLSGLNGIDLGVDGDGGMYAEVDAGCTIDAALDYLRAHGQYTLPTYGIIGKQTIAGAMSTATHGSGRASLSQYVSGVLVAAYDPDSGKARTYEWNRGDALRAARCALGCAGVVLSVRISVENDFLLEERTQWFDSLHEALGQERSYPLQQCFLIPWSWKWFVRLRRRAEDYEDGARPSANARVQRLVRLMAVDVIFNLTIKLLSRLKLWSAVRWLYRRCFPRLAKGGTLVVDESRRLLMMRHDLVHHVETELFVPAQHMAHASAFVEWVLRRCGGEPLELPAALRHDRFDRDVTADVERLHGRYVHAYPITVRRVLRDDTMISMTSGSGADAWYAISLITYERDLDGFLAAAAFLAETMAAAYGARPHWGKVCPLDGERVARLYPELPHFRAHCAAVDPDQVFVNDFTREALGFRAGPRARAIRTEETSCADA